MKRWMLLTVSHLIFAVAGFALGIYMLPILTADKAPEQAEVQAAMQQQQFSGTFKRDLAGSDFFHWGEGTISIGKDLIALEGDLAPGPDYKLYLSPEFVETEEDFLKIKDQMVQVSEIKTFKNFIVDVPEGIDPSQYKAAIVWCESFGEFITAATYQ